MVLRPLLPIARMALGQCLNTYKYKHLGSQGIWTMIGRCFLLWMYLFSFVFLTRCVLILSRNLHIISLLVLVHLNSTYFFTFSTISDRKGGMLSCLGCCCWDFLWQDLYTYVQYTRRLQTPTWMLPIELKGNVINWGRFRKERPNLSWVHIHGRAVFTIRSSYIIKVSR